MLDPMSMSLMGGNQVGEAIRRMTEGPRFADVGSIERGMAEVMELYLAVQTAARAYERVVAQRLDGGQPDASRRRWSSVSASGRHSLRPKDARKVWLDIANETLMRDASLHPFLEAQRQLLRAGMDFLLAERKLVEQLVEPAGLPTRTEIDEVHQTVQTLKRRVRTLGEDRRRRRRRPSRRQYPIAVDRGKAQRKGVKR